MVQLVKCKWAFLIQNLYAAPYNTTDLFSNRSFHLSDSTYSKGQREFRQKIVLVINPGHFIQPDIRKYRLRFMIVHSREKIAYEVLRVAMNCHYNLFPNTTAEVFSQK